MKLLLSLLLAITVAMGASTSTGEEMGWRDEKGQLVKNTDDRKAISGFGASVIITTDADWEKKWNTPAANTPTFTTAEKLKIGEQGTILIFFANPEPDSNGSIDVTCDIKIVRPDGSTTENAGLNGFKGRLNGSPENTYLTESIIRFVGEQSDPLGEWVIDISVRDNIRQVAVPLRLQFSLLPADNSKKAEMSEAELNDFMVHYYLHPDPAKVSRAVHTMHKIGYLQKESAGAPITSFLSQIFRSSSSAIETALADFSSYAATEQQVLLRALWLADTAQSKMTLQKLLAGNDNAELLKSIPPKIEQLPVESPDVLDMLWGAFLATGDEKYVIQVISVLPYSTIKGNIPHLLVGGSARWSLTSNAVQHKRVLDICEAQLEKQPKEVKEILSEVIAEAKKER